ncbi:MAG: hypothetical protein ACT4OJ_10825 [Bacteroidota bacterium]
MALETLYITGVEGLTEVFDAKLAYSEVMLCKREGKSLVETTDTPTGRRFRHNSAAAKIVLPADQPIFADHPETGTIFGAPEEFIIIIKN